LNAGSNLRQSRSSTSPLAAGYSEDAGALSGSRVDPIRIALVGDFPTEQVGDAKATLRLGEEHHAPSEVIRPPSKAALTFFHATGQVEGQQGIFVHRSSSLLRAVLLRSGTNARYGLDFDQLRNDNVWCDVNE
jgi:hypothetical protein